MTAIVQTIFSNVFFLNENVWFSIEVSLEIIPEGLIKNILELVNKWLVWIIVYVDDT